MEITVPAKKVRLKPDTTVVHAGDEMRMVGIDVHNLEARLLLPQVRAATAGESTPRWRPASAASPARWSSSRVRPS